jgi:hypothetical protein
LVVKQGKASDDSSFCKILNLKARARCDIPKVDVFCVTLHLRGMHDHARADAAATSDDTVAQSSERSTPLVPASPPQAVGELLEESNTHSEIIHTCDTADEMRARSSDDDAAAATTSPVRRDDGGDAWLTRGRDPDDPVVMRILDGEAFDTCFPGGSLPASHPFAWDRVTAQPKADHGTFSTR